MSLGSSLLLEKQRWVKLRTIELEAAQHLQLVKESKKKRRFALWRLLQEKLVEPMVALPLWSAQKQQQRAEVAYLAELVVVCSD